MRLKEAVEKLKGNWKKFESFCWFDKPDDADDWCIVYTSHRDSPIRDLSNAHYIKRRLNPLVDRTKDVIEFSANHWAVGHTDGWAVRVVGADGQATPAFHRLLRLLNLMENKVLLDPADYAERVERGKRISIEFSAKHCLPKGFCLKEELTEDWIDRVDELMHDIDPNWEDDLDEEGVPQPRGSDMLEALGRAGLLDTDV